MSRLDAQMDKAREKEMDDYFEAGYENSDFTYKCIYCGDVEIEACEMADFHIDKEEGICNNCACNEAYAADWGI